MNSSFQRNPIRIDQAGTGAVLLDCASGSFQEDQQRLIWAVARAARSLPGVRECVPGWNNLMVVFDALTVRPEQIEDSLGALWENTSPTCEAGREWTISVDYGGPCGEDLSMLADHAGLSPHDYVERHSAGTYLVVALGALAGYPYLSGLDPQLACPRRSSPRLRVPTGAVLVGGVQAGIMPRSSPSGWHIIGSTGFSLFDPMERSPARLSPGDIVRFEVASLQA